MDIKPNLFAPSTPPAQSSGSASEARRAFEAMLTAGAVRTRASQPAVTAPHNTPATVVRQPAPSQSNEPARLPDAPSRPGRVLDIKV